MSLLPGRFDTPQSRVESAQILICPLSSAPFGDTLDYGSSLLPASTHEALTLRDQRA
jgi:hypothetical protein